MNIRVYEEKRDLFYHALKAFGYQVVKPQGAFYLFPKAPIEDDVAFVKDLQVETDLDRSREGFRETRLFQNLLCCRK